MSLAYFIVLHLIFVFLSPLYKNYLKFASVALHLCLLYVVYVLSFSLPLVERLAFDSPLSIVFVLDSVSLFFTTLFIGVSFLFSLYMLDKKLSLGVFVTSILLLMAVLGLVLSHDLFNIYIFFEIASISAYILTSLNNDKKAYSGAIKYMMIGFVASIFLLLGIMLIYLYTGMLNLSLIQEVFPTLDEKIQFLIVLCLFIGFGIKAEIFPLNIWVADIYQASQTKINALFSAIVSKAYIFVFFHIAFLLQVPPEYLGFLAILGLVSFAIAEISAVGSRVSKRVFAYSTLGQIGLLFLALSFSDVTLMTGALFLIVVHALTKVLLFFALEIIEEHIDDATTAIFTKFQSLFLLIVFSVGLLSLLGLPPFGGFIAKLTILKGFATLGFYSIIGAILLISIIEAVYIFRIIGAMASRTTQTKVVIKTTLIQKILLGGLSLFLIFSGIFPQPLLELCKSVAIIFLQGGIHV